MMRKDRAKQAKELIEALRELNTEGMVCDALMECKDWETVIKKTQYSIISPNVFEPTKNTITFKSFMLTFKSCPWCGRELDWQNWKRLKGEKNDAKSFIT